MEKMNEVSENKKQKLPIQLNNECKFSVFMSFDLFLK